MRLELAALTPLDPLDRRVEWELAALLVALVVVPGALRAVAVSAAPATAPPRPAARRRAPTARLGTRTVRPPRSC